MKETKAPTLYLCGAIAGKTDDECKGWRNLAAARWAERYNGRVFDPMRHDYRYHSIDGALAKKIVEDDKKDIRSVDALLVWWEGPSVGTSMEIFYAHSLGTPIVLVVPRPLGPAYECLSPWLHYHVSAITNTLNDGLSLAHDEIIRKAPHPEMLL